MSWCRERSGRYRNWLNCLALRPANTVQMTSYCIKISISNQAYQTCIHGSVKGSISQKKPLQRSCVKQLRNSAGGLLFLMQVWRHYIPFWHSLADDSCMCKSRKEANRHQ